MEAKKPRKLPYGMSNFETLITDNYVYVDKTRFIELLENEPNRNLFFTRPRKFGKSLFLTMLSCYYDYGMTDKFDRLFGNFYIGKHPTPNKNNYVVLNLDFSALDTTSEERFRESFSDRIEDCVCNFFNDHRDSISYAGDIVEQMRLPASPPGIKSLGLIFRAAKEIGKKVFVIIDEYDHFANDIIAKGEGDGDEYYRKMVGANSIVRDFYETLKINSKTIIERILIVGITPIMLDDMTSGFNISNNISLKGKYNEILGFTQEEVEYLIEESGVDRSWISVDIKKMYNGYLFHAEGEKLVYNPSMMLYLFNELLDEKRPTENIIDENLKMDYGRIAKLFNNEANRQQLMDIVNNGSIGGRVVPKFSLNELTESSRFASLLFYFGLLTIDNTSSIPKLVIPNYSIKMVYWEYISKLTLERNEEIREDFSMLSDSMYKFAVNGKAQQFIEYISTAFVRNLSVRDLRQFDEKYLKIILLTNLFYGKYFIPISEMEVSEGVTDIYLMRSGIYRNMPYEWVWEIKYVKQTDANKPAVIEAKKQKSREQLAKYRSSYLFRDRTDVRYLSVIYIGKRKVEIEEI
ncbi:MAG: AAA family ATPase [Tannerella sp.]|nr:AAA family ATPase [Tannerella sp.]